MDVATSSQDHDNKDSDLFATGVIMSVLATLAVILRMGCKRHLKNPISADDYLIFVSLVGCEQELPTWLTR